MCSSKSYSCPLKKAKRFESFVLLERNSHKMYISKTKYKKKKKKRKKEKLKKVAVGASLSLEIKDRLYNT